MPPYANKDDEYLSRKSHVALCFRNIVDGIIGVTGSSTTSLTAFTLSFLFITVTIILIRGLYGFILKIRLIYPSCR